jgi:lipopolysaccharide export LptBFGC system permease protein LptF
MVQLIAGRLPVPVNCQVSPSADPALAHNGFTGALAFSYHTRWALGASPLVYALLVLSLGSLIRRRWLLAVIICLSFFAYFALLNLLVPWNSGLPPTAAAWSSNACLLAVAATAFIAARRRPGVSLSA